MGLRLSIITMKKTMADKSPMLPVKSTRRLTQTKEPSPECRR
jgi:hypothetical protein